MSEFTHYIPQDAMGISREQEEARDTIRTVESGVASEWEHFTPEFVGTKVQSMDLGAVREQMTDFRTIYEAGRIAQYEGKVLFGTTSPVTVFFVGDLHYGSVFTDHEWVHEVFQKIDETPNAYAVFMSNMIDNAIPAKFPDGMLSNSIPPDKQVVAMRKMVQGLNEHGKVLGAVTSPCHEGWTAQKTGQDINALIYGFEGRKFPVLENGGRLTLEFPGAEYTLGLYHKIGPFRSNFNLTHGLKQMNRLRQGMQCDIVAGAHYHNGAVESVFDGIGENRRQLVYVQSGSAKGIDHIHDAWSMGNMGATGEPTGQSVTLWATEKKMDEHLNFETGLLAQESYLLTHLARLK